MKSQVYELKKNQIDADSIYGFLNAFNELYAEFQDMEIVGEYSDEGHSGKNIKGRQEFMRMLNEFPCL